MEQVFAQPGEVQSTLSLLGVLLLVISALSFCRALQRLYERAWRLPSRGVRATPSHLLWLALVGVHASVAGALNTAAATWLGETGRLAAAFCLSFVVWLWTPYLLLSRRVERRALRSTAALTATGVVAFGVASVFYMPESIAASAERFGSIGIAIAIVSWLIGVGFVLVVAAALGAVLSGTPPGDRARLG